MPVTYEHLMSLATGDIAISYSQRDTILYALSIGMGRDPLDARELDYVCEGRPLKTLPSQAYVVARPPLIPTSGLDFRKVLHGEQEIVMARPLPAAGALVASSRISAVHDKGRDKGAVVMVETTAREASSQDVLFTATATIFARGDGGIGGPTVPAPKPHALPDRSPDLVVTAQTRPDQALLYRLTGDANPLHADPAVAAAAGYRRPILHGMCTFGIACREVLAHVCGYDHARISSLKARFTAPVFPGDTIESDLWIDGNAVSFRSRVPGRAGVVLDNGRCELRAEA